MVNILLGVTDDISIHVLREEDDFAMQLANYRELNFYPRPPRGGRPAEHMGAHTRQRNFYPRPPRGGRRKALCKAGAPVYFYPRPPRGGRPALYQLHGPGPAFLSTSSARRTTAGWRCSCWMGRHFYPRPPRGGRRKKRLNLSIGSKISIHVLREEDDGLILP